MEGRKIASSIDRSSSVIALMTVSHPSSGDAFHVVPIS